jgi:hypothetical protein
MYRSVSVTIYDKDDKQIDIMEFSSYALASAFVREIVFDHEIGDLSRIEIEID